MPRPSLADELAERMYARYMEGGVSLLDVGVEFDRCTKTVWRAFKTRGWPVRPSGIVPKPKTDKPKVEKPKTEKPPTALSDDLIADKSGTVTMQEYKRQRGWCETCVDGDHDDCGGCECWHSTHKKDAA